MCGQGPSYRTNSEQNDKSAKATSTNTATSYFGFNVVVLAAPAAACFAIHPLLVIITLIIFSCG